MSKILMFFVLLFAKNAFAQLDNDSDDCSLKCGNINDYLDNKLYCQNSSCNQSELCSGNCDSAKKFIDSKELCNEICIPWKSDICKKECITDEDLWLNHKYCVESCDFYEPCEKKCNNNNFDMNEDFCENYCPSHFAEKCEKICVKEKNSCHYKCHRHFPVLCKQYCRLAEVFLMNYDFCRDHCGPFKSDLCQNLCNTKDLFNENYDLCFNACDEFPDEICNQKCSSAENFALNGDLCYGGCSYLSKGICEKDCDNLEKFLKQEFCRDCESTKLYICSDTCLYDRSSYDMNMKFCNENCTSVPNEVCDEKCNATEIILTNKAFCIKGCDSNLTKLCKNKCATENLKIEHTAYCEFCKTKPVKYPMSVRPGIDIRPKTCISLLCG